MDTTELQHKAISPLVPRQFPSFYLDEGPVFIKFVQEYYRWMEASFPAANLSLDTNGLVSIAAKSNLVRGNNTSFTSYFEVGSLIAIYYDETNYSIYRVDSVLDDNTLYLTNDNLPHVTASNIPYRTVRDQKNPLYYSRRLLDNHDIDICEDEFVLLFKEKYLKDIYFNTIIDVRKFIKHSLDLYRSKGTERSIDLLYRSVFGMPASVYYPSQDLFTLSSGKWFIPKYIELSLNDRNYELQNKQVTGITSGATAFVDGIVRKTIKNKLVDVAYISAINGNFITGEKIAGGNLSLQDSPIMVGSLNKIRIPEGFGGSNFNIGDLLTVSAHNGQGALARVLAISNNQGTLNFELIDGGYGYSNTATVLISDTILTVNGVSSGDPLGYLELFDEIIQPLANLHFVQANGNFAQGDTLYTYHPNNAVKGEARVLQLNLANTTSGYMTISVLSGNMDSASFYKTGNTVTANLDVLDGYVDLTATANVIGYYPNTTLSLNNATTQFVVGELIIQPSTGAQGKVFGQGAVDINNNMTVTLRELSGAFIPTDGVVGSISGATANVWSSQVSVGVIDIAGSGFVSFPGNYVYANGTNFVGTITRQSQGAGGSFMVSDLQYTETVDFNTDFILPYANVALDANAFGFPKEPSANISSNTPLIDIFTFMTKTIGSIGRLVPISFGSNYNQIPIALIFDEDMYTYGKDFERRDTQILHVTDVDASFEIGELVTQPSTSARGIVRSANSSQIRIKRMRYYSNNQFEPTSGFTSQVMGMNSGATANVVLTEIVMSSKMYGMDAETYISLTSANGVLEQVQVLDSGIGYNDLDELTLESNNGNIAHGFGTLETIGTGSGYYKDRNGFLSSTKKLIDGDYWQYYSYDVRSSVIDDRKKELKKVVHVAGTKYFDTLRYESNQPVDTIVYTEQSIT